jgi:hypothetical protein
MSYLRGFVITETDSGTKEKARRALSATYKKLDKEFLEAAKEYWYKVWQTARQLCLQYGAYDTGALYNSIQLLWQSVPYGGLYEIGVSSRGVEMTSMIKVGGAGFINPKTGKFVDYAQAVHDGTRYMAARPFLTDAIVLCEPFLQAVLTKHVDIALSRFEREY